MRLRSVTVRNFRAIDTLTLDFFDPIGRTRPVTVIAGPNGCGKTSLVFGVVQALRGVMGYQTADVPMPSQADIHQVEGMGGLSPEPIEASVEFEVEFDEAERTAIPQVFEDTRDHRPGPSQPPDLPDGRIRAEWKYPPPRLADGTLRPVWYLDWMEPRNALPWFRGCQYAIQGLRNRRLRSRQLLDRVGGLYLFPQDRGLKSRVLGEDSDLPEGDVENGNIGNGSDDRRQGRRSFASVDGILKYLSEYARGASLRPTDSPEPLEEEVKNTFNRICAPKEYLGVMFDPATRVGAPYFRDGNSVYPLHMASSGEQVIIEYIARLSYPSPMNHSLILIDEPELHLHPGWVRQLFLALPEIGQGNQYIMTTHSEELRRIAAEEGVLVTLGPLGGEAE
ncbi:MAG: AAA family ATPase [Planctomycetes bacterium]|nr:AAA family ATPase [Planctomycetota bacterium]